MTELSNLAGKIFGRLSVVARDSNSPGGHARWLCQCSCGGSVTALGTNLRRGFTRSCGCFQTESRFVVKSIKHGDCRSSEHMAWGSMIQRCENPKAKNYYRYGGRGISVCPKWRDSYEAFLADVGRKPTAEHSLDRWPDRDGNYEPGNIRWATAKEQAQNRDNGNIGKWPRTVKVKAA